MNIPVGTEVHTSTTGERSFKCRRCGHEAMAMVTGHGKGAETYLASAGTAERRGFADATRDLDRTIRLARCPRCKRRNPGALLRFVGFFAGICLAMVALGFIFSAVLKMGDMWWLMPAILAGTSILITPAQMANRWRSLDERVRWL